MNGRRWSILYRSSCAWERWLGQAHVREVQRVETSARYSDGPPLFSFNISRSLAHARNVAADCCSGCRRPNPLLSLAAAASPRSPPRVPRLRTTLQLPTRGRPRNPSRGARARGTAPFARASSCSSRTKKYFQDGEGGGVSYGHTSI
jgi:hypothetical protein